MTINKKHAPSLYAQDQAAWDRIAAMGCESLMEMSKHFDLCADMDRALGFKNAAAKWHRGANRPSTEANMRARAWIVENVEQSDPAPVPSQMILDLKDKPKVITMLVTCDSDQMQKVSRVLSILGCNVVEI
jgi:hypothetical protein